MSRKNEQMVTSFLKESSRSRNLKSSKYLRDTHYSFKNPNMGSSKASNQFEKRGYDGDKENRRLANGARRSRDASGIKNYVVEELHTESVSKDGSEVEDYQIYSLRSELDRLKRDKAMKEKEMEMTKREMKCIKTSLARNQKFLMELKDEMLEAKTKSFAGSLNMKELL